MLDMPLLTDRCRLPQWWDIPERGSVMGCRRVGFMMQVGRGDWLCCLRSIRLCDHSPPLPSLQVVHGGCGLPQLSSVLGEAALMLDMTSRCAAYTALMPYACMNLSHLWRASAVGQC